jgi:dolichol-phosphate hexosyltransferase
MNQSSTQKKKISVLIPCHNEGKSIEAVIKSFPMAKLEKHDFSLEIVVIDNNSSDNTADVARALGATVLHEPKKGKGNAMRTGFKYVLDRKADYIVMLDGDDTYRPEEILRLVEPMDSGFTKMVIGSRLAGRITEGSMTSFNRLGNWIFSHLARYIYRVNITDVLTGYFAWTHKAVEDMHPHLVSEGFAIEMEMVTKMALLDYEIYSVPITYHSRGGESHLRPIRDGFRILGMLVRNLFWKPGIHHIKHSESVNVTAEPVRVSATLL